MEDHEITPSNAHRFQSSHEAVIRVVKAGYGTLKFLKGHWFHQGMEARDLSVNLPEFDK